MEINIKNVIVSIILAVFFSLLIVGECHLHRLRKSFVLGVAKIERVSPTRGRYSGSTRFYYSFWIKGKEYSHNRSFQTVWLPDTGYPIKGKYFPMAYSPDDPTLHDLLITEEDFYEYGLIQPDSLKWADRYFQ